MGRYAAWLLAVFVLGALRRYKFYELYRWDGWRGEDVRKISLDKVMFAMSPLLRQDASVRPRLKQIKKMARI